MTRRSQLAEGIISLQSHVTRQQEQIRVMMNDNDELKKQISSASGKDYDYVRADKIATLQGEVDALERRYQLEKLRKNDLAKRYQLSRIDLLHSRKVKGGVNMEKEQAEAVQRQVDVLENRLDQALGKFNDALSYNKELRDQIDIIRGERRVFQRVYKKMDDDLRNKKRVMAERLEQCNKDIDERDGYIHQAEQLRQAIAEQQEEYKEHLRGLDSSMMEIKTMREEQNKLHLEIEVREYEFEQQLGEAAANPNKNAAALGVSNTSVSVEEDPTTKILRVDKESHTITEIMNLIHDETQQDDLDNIRRQYLRLRDNNFSLYKHINELTATNESLGDEIRDLKLLLSEESRTESEQRRLIKGLECQLASTEGKLSEIDSTINKLHSAIMTTVATTEDVYEHIGCPLMPKNPLPKDSKCTESNLLIFLASIEERATHILGAFQSHHRNQTKRLDGTESMGSSPHKSPAALAIEDDEENALSVATEHPTPCSTGCPPVLCADDIEVDLTAPLLPTMPITVHNAISAQRLVRTAELPSANLGAAESDSLMGDLGDDYVIDHEDARRVMEQRLQMKREREDRMQRKKRNDVGSPRVRAKGKQ